MNYVEKLNRMDAHLEKHPHDYQTVISRLKTASDAYDHAQRQKRVARLKRLSDIRKELQEEDRRRGR